ncbi:MAG: GDP-mannose 4,6-dehydratase [Candidatus Pacebacteria bacterium]|nr:GDP-mannose 4,6-dehydratase [Candidatus Paceibacterota bacterium]
MPKKIIFDKKNVLVAGGAGFIGSHLCDELIKEAKVICIDNFSSGDERNIDHLLSNPNFVFINYDLSQPLNLEKVPSLESFKIKFQGIQEIYNLACPISPKNFDENKVKIVESNSLVIKNLLDLALQYKAKFLHLSSSVIYGLRRDEVQDYLVREDDMGQVSVNSDRSCYDEGKRFAEAIISTYNQKFNLGAKIIRLFRTYGPRMRLNDDQMIPDFISHAMENKELIIYGDEKFSSSFCYVSDVIDAIVKVMSSDLSEPINIGSDIDINLTEVAKKVISMLDSSSTISYQEPRLFMTPLLLPDIHKARNDLGWMPVVGIDEGLKKTIFDLQSKKRLRNF